MPQKDPEEARKYRQKYYQSNKEKCDKRNVQWRKNNPEKAHIILKRYEQTEKGKLASKRKFIKYNKTEKAKNRLIRYRQRHRAEINKKRKQYRSENLEKVRRVDRLSKQKHPETRKAYCEKNRKKLNELASLRYKNNPEKIKGIHRRYRMTEKFKIGSRKRQLKQYGLTLDDYDVMFERQNGVCAICGKPETRTFKGVITRLQVDHCHRSKKVRGLLCNLCNFRLGVLENEEFRKKAESYLKPS